MPKAHSSRTPYVQPYRYPSPDVPLSVIRRFARQIAARFRPKKIILYGSYAYGTPHAESDVDLLVVMPASNEITQAIRIKQAFERPFALDLIVKTPSKMARGLRDEDWFLREIVEKGKLLYEAANRTVGAKGRGGSHRRSKPRRPDAAAAGPGVLSLPASRRRVSQGTASRAKHRHSKNA